jgi:hypothetical protein
MARSAPFLLALFLGACFPPGSGIDPPEDRFYFPVGLALDASASHLFVVSSDFDLQFNAGRVHALDLDKLEPVVLRILEGRCEPADGLREQEAWARLLYPGRCTAIHPWSYPFDDDRATDTKDPMVVGNVQIGAFATDVVYRGRPLDAPAGEPGRLFIPVRGDATLHFIDVAADGSLHCGQAGTGPCDAVHRAGDDPASENTRGARLLPEPYGVDVDERGSVVLVTNQTAGAAGLFLNDWERGARYEFTLGGLPDRPMGVAALPEPRVVPALGLDHLPGFLVGFRNAATLYMVRTYFDEGANPPRPYAKVPASAALTTNSVGTDSRGLAVDASLRREEERRCAERFGLDDVTAQDPAAAQAAGPAYATCVTEASAVPLDVFVTNRAPASLLVGRSRPALADIASNDVPAFHTTVPVPFGPARVVMGDVHTPSGELERRAFVLSFDARRVTIYDPRRQRVEAEIVTGRGPQAFAVDSKRGFGYVAHFSDSYLGVVDLDQRRPRTYGTVVASVGSPQPPRGSQPGASR